MIPTFIQSRRQVGNGVGPPEVEDQVPKGNVQKEIGEKSRKRKTERQRQTKTKERYVIRTLFAGGIRELLGHVFKTVNFVFKTLFFKDKVYNAQSLQGFKDKVYNALS